MAIAHVQTQVANTTGATTVTSSFAVGAGTDRSLTAMLLWIDNTGAAAPTGSSVVFNTSENFSFRVRAQLNYATDNYLTSEGWSLDNPTNTTANVVGTISEINDTGDGLTLVVTEYTGANNGVGVNTGAATGTSTAPSCTFTTGASDSWIIGGIVQQTASGGPYTPGSGSVERADSTNNNISFWMADEPATGGSDTFNATSTGSFRWAIAAFELKAAAAAAGGQPMQMRGMMAGLHQWHPRIGR